MKNIFLNSVLYFIFALFLLSFFSGCDCSCKQSDKKNTEKEVADSAQPIDTNELIALYNIKSNTEEDCLKLYEDAYDSITDVPGLPRVLLIGDSVSQGYTSLVRERLKGKFNVHRIPINGRASTAGLKFLDGWLGDEKWDVIHFNFGLHDIEHSNETEGIWRTSLDTYKKNLEEIVQKLKMTDAVLIWASTTAVRDELARGSRFNVDAIRYNDVAKAIMIQNDIPINDLYKASMSVDSLSKIQADSVHFNVIGYNMLADKVAGHIEMALKDSQ